MPAPSPSLPEGYAARPLTVDDARAVFEVMHAQELHDLLRHDGASVGLTTVYRHLTALAESGYVDVLRTGGGEAVYRRCPTSEHHHHLVCRSCGRSVEVEGPEVETWAAGVAADHVEHLKGGALTVTLWRGVKSGVPTRQRRAA